MVYPFTVVIVSTSLHSANSRLNSIPLVAFAIAANKDTSNALSTSTHLLAVFQLFHLLTYSSASEQS